MEWLKNMIDQIMAHPAVDRVQEISIELAAWTKENPVVGGVIGVWFLGVASYWLRSVPNKLSSLAKRHLTITVSMTNDSEIYEYAMQWFEENGYSAKARTLRIQTSENNTSKTIVSPGYGNFYFWFHGWPYLMHKSREGGDSGTSSKVKEAIEISTIARSHSKFRMLLDEFKKFAETGDGLRISKWSTHYWNTIAKQAPRPLESVVLDPVVKKTVVDAVDRFIANKSWYVRCGIPYRMGIALHGVPGTGKTSLALAICAHLQRNLNIISLSSVSDSSLQSAMMAIEDDEIVLMEDVDTFGVSKKRKGDALEDTDDDAKALTLSGLLNAIDGPVSSHGRILIMTTNHLEKLDPALIRPGRCDVIVELGHLTDETARMMSQRFWPDFSIPEDWSIREKVTPAEFQQQALAHMNDPMIALLAIAKKDN